MSTISWFIRRDFGSFLVQTRVSCTMNKVNICSNWWWTWTKKHHPQGGGQKSGHLSCIFRESAQQWSGSRLVVPSSEWIRLLKGVLTDNHQPYQTQLDTDSPLTRVHRARKTVALSRSASSGDGILNGQLVFVSLSAPSDPGILQKLQKRTTHKRNSWRPLHLFPLTV